MRRACLEYGVGQDKSRPLTQDSLPLLKHFLMKPNLVELKFMHRKSCCKDTLARSKTTQDNADSRSLDGLTKDQHDGGHWRPPLFAHYSTVFIISPPPCSLRVSQAYYWYSDSLTLSRPGSTRLHVAKTRMIRWTCP